MSRNLFDNVIQHNKRFDLIRHQRALHFFHSLSSIWAVRIPVMTYLLFFDILTNFSQIIFRNSFSIVFFWVIGALLNLTLGYGSYFGVIVSLVSVLTYLLAGGLYAGTLTDALQFIYLFLGLVSVEQTLRSS